VAAGGLSTVGGTAAHAANACGLPELDQNVFMSGGSGEGSWTNPLLWSKGHTPRAGDDNVCVPGGTVGIVNTDIELVGAAVDHVTTLRIEGTIRVTGGAHAATNGIYGGTNLVNGGVIQVLGNSTLDLAPDQNGAPAFQNVGNVIGGGQIQVEAGSTLNLRRPLSNNGTVDLTGGGTLNISVPTEVASAYSGTGTVIGAPMRLFSGVVDPSAGGPLAVRGLANGGIRGTINANQTVEFQCDTYTGGFGLFGNVVNNGTVRLLPPVKGECSVPLGLRFENGGQSFTNNGQFIVGDAARPKGYGYYVLGQSEGEFVNGPNGQVVLNDTWSDGVKVTNNGTWTVEPTGGYLNGHDPTFINNGTFRNDGYCTMRQLTNNGLFDLAKDCAVTFKSTHNPSGTLRLHAGATKITKITGGDRQSTVGGTLDIVTDPVSPPAIGTVSDILETGVAGTFSAVTSSTAGYTYEAIYTDNARPQVKLISFTPVSSGGGGGGGGGAAITALNPGRLLDTRANGTTVDGVGQAAGLLGVGATIEVPVAGRGGVPADASAAVLNVTVTEAQGAGFVTVWPCGADRPNASSLNFVTGATVANGVISKIGVDGKLCLYVSNPTQLIVDVAGFFSATSPYVPLVPSRVLDTRPGGQTADGLGQGGGPAAAASITEVPILGRAGVPSGAAAAVLNVTVTEASAPGYVTVFPCGEPTPNASSLNFVTGSSVPNNVIGKIGEGGTICLFASQATHLLVDVGGYFTPSAAFQALTPARVLDTRASGATVDGNGQAAGIQPVGATIEVPVIGRAGVPAGASAVVLNVTVTEAQGPGFVTVWPCGIDRPNASSVNFVAGATVPNGVIGKVGDGGKVCLYVSNATHLITDVAGYFTS
jgi:hypothetical protein